MPAIARANPPSHRFSAARTTRYVPANVAISGWTAAVTSNQPAARRPVPPATLATAINAAGVDSEREVTYGSTRYRLVPATGIVSTEATSATPHQIAACDRKHSRAIRQLASSTAKIETT